MSHRIIRLSEVMFTVPLCRSSIYLKIKEGTFPKPVPLGGRAVGWLEEEIQAWIQEQIDSSRKTEV